MANSDLFTKLLDGPFSHFKKVGEDDWRDPGVKNPGFSISSKGYFNHNSELKGSLYDLCKENDLIPAENRNLDTNKKEFPQIIWEKSSRAEHPESYAFKLTENYLTKCRKIPLKNYSDLLKKGLIRVNEYKGDKTLIYPSLTPDESIQALSGKSYSLKRIQRIYLNSDGTKHTKGKKHYGSNGEASAGFFIQAFGDCDSKYVIIMEGLEDALSLRQEYPQCWFLVATDKSGLKHLTGFFNRGATESCLIIADHDTDNKPEITGQHLSWKLGKRLEDMGIRVTVKMPKRPKEDANSALQSGQLETWLKSLIEIPEKYQKTEEAFKTEEWQSPISLVREQEESQPYPIDDLGPIIGEAAKEFQNYGKQPLSMVGSSALATASLCCQGLADVSRDSQNTSPISLYFLSIAESGERKTSTDKAFSKSLRDWQRYKAEEIKDEVRISVAQHAAWEAERTGLLTAIREAKRLSKPINGKSLDNLKNELESHELGKPEMLQPPRLFFEDTNAEALAYFAAKGYPSFSLWSDEAGLTIGSHGMRDDRMMGFLALLNRLWDGGEFEPSRKIAKTAQIIGRRATVNLMLQNSILEHWQEAGKGLTRGMGAFARFLILKPISTIGSRKYKEPPTSLPMMDQFHRRVREIMDTLPLPFGDQGQLDPPTLLFSPDAKKEWIQCFNEIESALGSGKIFADIPDFASKFGEQAARIAGVLHIFENGPTGMIELGTMQRAIRIAKWHIWEANLIFNSSSLPQKFKDAILLLNWILAHCEKSQKSQESQLSHKSILHEGPNRLRDKKRRDEALKVLEDHQTLRLETVNKVKMIKVNPALTN